VSTTQKHKKKEKKHKQIKNDQQVTAKSVSSVMQSDKLVAYNESV